MSIPSEMNVFRPIINLALLNDLIGFITETAKPDHTQYQDLHTRCLFLTDKPSKSVFQEKYGFLYLGELLERYEERFGMADADLRAIMLALGYTKDIVTDEMFVGNQRVNFLQMARRKAGNDLYLTGAFYLLAEGQSGAVEWMEKLVQFPYRETEEMIFTMSLLPSLEAVFTKFKSRLLTLLGKGRTMAVMGNTRVLDWAIAALQPILKENRSKDLKLLRSLCALPRSYVKAGSRHYEVLLEHGYTPLGIAYANVMAIQHQTGTDALSLHSITTEKAVVALFSAALSQESDLPDVAYLQLSKLYQRYATFRIKCYGEEKLLDALQDEVQICVPKTFLWFSDYASVSHPAFAAFDMMDPLWDEVASGMDYYRYLRFFESKLRADMDVGTIRERIERFNSLTGKDYLGTYWDDQHGTLFELLVEKDVLDLWQAFLASLDDSGTVVKPIMVKRIKVYLEGIKTVQAFHFYEQFLPQYGFDGLEKYFDKNWNFINSLVDRNDYRDNSVSRLKLEQKYLDGSMKLQLIAWLEEYYFTREPVWYLSFITAVLRYEEAETELGYPALRQIFDLVISHEELLQNGIASVLKMRYFTPEEQQAENDAQNAATQERERIEQQLMIQELRDAYEQHTDGSFNSILDHLEGYRYRKEKRQIVATIACEQMEDMLEQRCYQIDTAECPAFLQICADFVKWGMMDYSDAQKKISNTTMKEAA